MRVLGVVLAAGNSTRLGRPKALVEWGGQTFLDRVLAAFEGGGAREVCVVTGGAHCRAIEGAVTAREHRVPVRVAYNLAPESGPMGSLRVAAAHGEAADTALLVHPVDIPGITAADVSTVIETSLRATPVDAVIPSFAGRRAHPVWLAPALVARLGRYDPSITLRDILRDPTTQIAYAVVANGLLLRDVDTPEDLAWLESQAPRGPGVFDP
ncbi:MAG: NTP transferase domain-containing protein [Planctomycetota bacterium]